MLLRAPLDPGLIPGMTGCVAVADGSSLIRLLNKSALASIGVGF